MTDEKIIIYQVLPRLFSNRCASCVPNGTYEQNGSGKLNDFTPKVLNEIKKLGANYIWYTGVIEHATKTDYSRYGIRPDNKYVVKGEAGSPYAIKDYYDIDPDLAENPLERMHEFEALVARTHEAGLKVVLDFVPNHVARQYHSDAAPQGVEDLGAHDNKEMHFSPSNNFYYIPRQAFTPQFYIGEGDDRYFEYPAKATGNDCFGAFPNENDWYETVKLNYGVDYMGGHRLCFDPIPDTWHKMLDILLFWCGKGIDAFRCDMAHMVPVEFWGWAISRVKESYPQVLFIAEIYDQGLYRLYLEKGKFDYLYDKVGLYDKLRGVLCHQVSAAQLTYCWQAVDGIGGHMLNFLENHDEQRFASPFFAGDADKAIPALAVATLMSTGPMMIYFGQELGERGDDAEGFSGHDGRTTIFDYWSVPTVRQWYDGGRCSIAKLTSQQKRLRNLYKTILHIGRHEKAVSQGSFFDLMYVNGENPHLNPHRHYTFLRKYGRELLLVAVNFDSRPTQVAINLPGHAFDTLKIVAGQYEATELISGEKGTKTISPDTPFDCALPAYGAVVWKMELKNFSQRNIEKMKKDKKISK